MGMRPSDFEELTPAEFFYAWVGWSKNQTDRQKQEWERTRWQTWVLTCIQMEKKDRKDMVTMFPLPWEKAPESKPIKSSAELTPEERQKRIDELLKCIPKKQ